MKVFTTVLLINTLYATLQHIERSPEIDRNSPAFREFKRTLIDQILKLRASEQGSGLSAGSPIS